MTQISFEIPRLGRTGSLSGIAAMIASVCFVVACAIAPGSRDKSIALVFPPGTSFPEAASRLAPLDGRIMRIGASENIVIVRFFSGWHLDDLWRIGVLLPLKARGVGDCLNSSTKQQLSPRSPV